MKLLCAGCVSLNMSSNIILRMKDGGEFVLRYTNGRSSGTQTSNMVDVPIGQLAEYLTLYPPTEFRYSSFNGNLDSLAIYADTFINGTALCIYHSFRRAGEI